MPLSITDTYPLGSAGNACYVCNAAQRTLAGGRVESVVDFGRQIDFEGFLFVCETCITEAAGLLGWIDEATYKNHIVNVATARAERDAAVAERDEAVLVADAIRRYDETLGITVPDTESVELTPTAEAEAPKRSRAKKPA